MKKILFAFGSLLFILTACNTTKPEEEKKTPHEMVREGLIDDAKHEFMVPSDVNALDADGNTVLHLAALINDADLCTFLMIKGADPELKNNAGDTALHVAIKSGSMEAAKALTQMGANIFARDGEETTALDMGLRASTAYYEILITTKAGEIRDVDGQTIVHYFVLTKNLRAIEQCIKKSLPLSIPDNNGVMPLDLCFKEKNDDTLIYIAAALILGGADEITGDCSYFYDALSARNLDLRFEDNQAPLHISAISGYTSIAKYLLENGALPNVQNSAGATPLHEAIRYGNIEIAKMLLDSGANVNAQDNLGKTPIMVVMPISKADEEFKLLVSYKADVSHKDAYGDTIMHIATMTHLSIPTLDFAVQNGAEIDTKNKDGVTPFEIAIQRGDKQLTEFFAKHGANIHSKDMYGNSPITLALAATDEVFEAAITAENAITQDSEGNTPLHVALLCDAPITKIKYVGSLTSNVNMRNSDGNSALYLACLKNQRDVGDMLLAKNADIFSTNKDSDSPLRIALRQNGKQNPQRQGVTVQDWLITSNTIKATDGSGNTCLHYAAEWQYGSSIKALMEKGADPYAKNANGETPLFSAAKTDNPDIVSLIVDTGTRINERDNLGSTALHMAVRWNATKSIQRLVECGIDINAQNSSGKSALAEAAFSGKLETAETLLNYGADVNSSDTTGFTILMEAIRGRNKDVISLLLKYDANVAIQTTNGRSAYHEAALTGDTEIIGLIRNAGGNPLGRDKKGTTPFSLVMNGDMRIIKEVLGSSTSITDSDGNTPIHLVVRDKGSTKLLRELVRSGYPIDGRNASGYTAIAYAVENNYTEVALILLESGANPFQPINRKGQNAVTLALDKNDKTMISNIVKYAGTLSDIQGNTILHYAAKSSSDATIEQLLSFGLDKNIKNISGDTPYMVAIRWKRNDIANMLR